MTNEEAIKFINGFKKCFERMESNGVLGKWGEYYAACDIAISALRRVDWEDTIWHDAETDPPRTPGLYYGKKDDTNSMYAVNYRDGVWTLDAYPDHKMQIIQWANYGAFGREENDE